MRETLTRSKGRPGLGLGGFGFCSYSIDALSLLVVFFQLLLQLSL